jgi:prepilin-type N-terminal cleavage/methylation domain-containing protein
MAIEIGLKNKNSFFNVSGKTAGFTLVEVLVVILSFGILAVVGSSLFISILKGAAKAEIEKEIKQNGDYAINVMERMIRNAREISSCSSSSIRIKNPDGSNTTFSCLVNNSQVASIASNSAFLTGRNVTLDSSGGTNCFSPNLSPNLTFSCTSDNPPKVSISFTLYQKGSTVRPEERAQAKFETTVSLRTYR